MYTFARCRECIKCVCDETLYALLILHLSSGQQLNKTSKLEKTKKA